MSNWFNQELYGQPTTLPWALEIDPAHHILGLGLNDWVATLIFLTAIGYLWATRRHSVRNGG